MKILGLGDTITIQKFKGKVLDISKSGVTLESRKVKRVYTLKEVEKACLPKS